LKYCYGYKRGLPDHRDFKFAFSGNPVDLPRSFQLGKGAPFIFNQAPLGSCTGNGISMAIKQWCVLNNYKWPYTPSRLQIYYEERALEGTTQTDSGAIIRDGFKVINTQGVCPEDETSSWNWPYDISKFTDAPPPACMQDAALHKCLQYAQVNQDQQSVQAALVNGTPLVIGITCYPGIEADSTAATGIIPMPGLFDAPVGGHCLCVDRYDEDYVSGPNSWGSSWGANPNGYFHLPWKYLLDPNLCSDIWSVGLIT
jgi:C1A family cysteine protease